MQALILTHKGLEPYCAQELQEYLPKTTQPAPKEGEGCVLFDFEKFEDLFLLCYKMQSAMRIISLSGTAPRTSNEAVLEACKQIVWDPTFLNHTSTFAVHQLKEDNEISNDLAAELGGMIIDQTHAKVNLKKPEVSVVFYETSGMFFVGIDMAGFDLSKRQHRLFGLNTGIRGTVAFSLLKVAGYLKKDVNKHLLVDPFCGSGDVIIEATLYASGFSVNFFNKERFAFRRMHAFSDIDFDAFFAKLDPPAKKERLPIHGCDKELKNVANAEKNAKIAGVGKLAKISRIDLQWLDIKKDKETIDFVVSYAPGLRREQEKEREKMYKELFYQLEFVMKKKGVAVIATEYPDQAKKYAQEYKFTLEKEFLAWQGKKELWVLKWRR